MTDTGQLPGEGQPGHADAQPEPQQPHSTAAAHGAYAYAGPETGQAGSPGDEEDLLMPGAQGAWGDGQPAVTHHDGQVPGAPGPEAHEAGGRADATGDHGAHAAAHPGTPAAGIPAQSQAPQPQQNSVPQAGAPRRPLHLGPPVPEQSGAVRTLADRGPRSRAPQAAQQTGAVPAPAPAAGPDEAQQAGPEYLDVTYPEPGSPAGAPPVDSPAQQDPWTSPSPRAPGDQDVAGVPGTEAADLSTPSLPGPDLAAVPGPAATTAPLEAQSAPATDPDAPSVSAAAAEPAREQHAPRPPQTDARQDAEAAPATPDVAAADGHAPETLSEPVGLTEPVDDADAPESQAAVSEVVVEPVAETPADGALPTEAEEPVVETPAPVADAEPEPPAGPDTAEAATRVPAGPVAGEDPGTTEPTGEPVAQEPAAQEPAAQELEPDAATADAERVPDVTPEDAAPEAATPEDTAAPIGDAEPEPAEEDVPPVLPAAPGYDEADRETVHRLMRERRDIRNGFRSDPIPHEVLLRVLEAAHTAPSVGHSQPWDFVVIRSEETRRTMHELAQRQREAYAKSLPKARAKQFKQLKIEAILDTPVNIVVTADPTRGGRHTLGRHTQPQMAPYSSALAVENLWLAARAEGLGVGWVSFFDEAEMVRTLDLPGHLDVVAYLCIGYVDEFPPEPELMQAGWSKRRPLSWVVHEESYGRRALPGAEPHDLLAETLERIRPLDAKALGEAWERQKRMTKPAGALGMLEIISAQLCGLSRQCPPPVPEPAAVAVFAGDHGVHAQGVTPWPQEVTAQMVANFLDGGAVCNAFANQVGAEVCVIDVGVSGELPAAPGLLPRKVRPGTADMTQGPALTHEEVLRAIEVGIETARDLVAAGNKALVTGEMGIANTTASAALIAACTGADPAEITGRGTGVDDDTHARKVEVVRRALQLHQPDPADPVGLLAAIGGLEHAALTGFILGGASLRTPVILDGVSAGAAALVARQITPEALAACVAGHRSAEPGHVAALTKLGLRPLIDLDLRLGEGTGALLALPMVQSAARAMHEVATFDSAGVTEKG